MNHRATMYTVGVHKQYKPKDLLPFNDFDGKGASLADCLNGYLSDGFMEEGDERAVRCTQSNVIGDEIQALLTHGQSGMVAVIRGPQGHERLRQAVDDTHEVSCGLVLRLPGDETTGWWASHVIGTRSAKSLLKHGLVRRFMNDYPKLRLVVRPCVSGAALTAAVDSGEVESVKLVRLERPGDRRDRLTTQWVRRDQTAHIEVGIRAGRDQNVLNGLLRRFFGGERNLFGQIVEFNGVEFDQAKISVSLPNGSTRTFNIEHPDSGHAFSVDLEDLDLRDGAPTPDSLFAAMGTAIDEMVAELQ
jgi:hypothetical protein